MIVFSVPLSFLIYKVGITIPLSVLVRVLWDEMQELVLETAKPCS